MSQSQSPATLSDLLQVQTTETELSFVGDSFAYGDHRMVYGGHFLGQALSAAFQTVSETKCAHSLHAYFLAAGDPDAEIHYRVTRLRDGGRSQVRDIAASQGDRRVFQMQASFKEPEQTNDHHQRQMPEVPTPEQTVARNAADERGFNFPMTQAGLALVELISDTFFPDTFTPGREPKLACWMRVPHAQNLTVQQQQCLIAFLGDGTLMFNSILPYGVPFQSHRMTSLDHAMWFHQHTDADEWLLFDQCSLAVDDSRGLNQGEIFDRAGRLIASCTQESMLRPM